MCSTPFGITEFRGGLQRLGQQLGLVLNAFRHHRVSRKFRHAKREEDIPCSTPFGITEFRGWEPYSKRRPTQPGAQRLSASQSFAGIRLAPATATHSVLNAFRHHRVSRNNRRSGIQSCCDVLNAFRHHRVSRYCASISSPLLLSCSTPFGITEFRGHGFCVKSAILGIVLNAFRHHRVSRSVNRLRLAGPRRVLNAFRHHRVSRAGRIPRRSPAP